MTATQASPTSNATSGFGRSGFFPALRAESIKLWSLRSTPWTVLALVIVTVGLCVLSGWGISQELSQHPDELSSIGDMTSAIFFVPTLLGQLPAAVLGVLVVSNEYSSGGIRTTLTATPNRSRLLLAKVVNFALVITVVGLICSFAGFFIAASFLDGGVGRISLSDTHVLRATIGAGLYIGASGLFGLAVATLVRKSAGAISIAVALLLVIPLVLSGLPFDVTQSINKYFIATAGRQIFSRFVADGSLAPWDGFGVFCGEWVFGLLIGWLLLRRRDA